MGGGGGTQRKVFQVTDVMQHGPVESIIFNSYKSMLKKATGEEKRFLRKMGSAKYHKLVVDMMQNKTNPKADVCLCAAQTLQNVVDLTMSARKAFGHARLTTATKSTEFMRVILGTDDTEVAAGGGFYCQECVTQPKNDYHWTVGRKCGSLSGWFCANQGCPYDTKRMAGLITFADKKDPAGSFVMNTRMPQGSTANMLAAMKLVNLIRNGECELTTEDIRKAGGLGHALKKIIGKDNERYSRLFGMLRGVAVGGTLHAPNLGDHHCPEFKICEGDNDVTLRREDYGRPYVMYDVGKLFDGEEPAEASDGAWKGIVQTVLNAWGIAEAVAIHPEMNQYTQCSKKTLKKLRTWTHIRHTKRHPPDDNGVLSMTEASESDQSWASLPFDEF